MKLFLFIILFSTGFATYLLINSRMIDIETPTLEPDEREITLICDKPEFKPLLERVEKMLINPTYINYRVEDKLCSLDQEFGHIVRIKGVLFEPDLNMERKEHLILWKTKKGKITTLSMGDSSWRDVEG